MLAFAGAAASRAADAPGPMEHEFPVATLTALLRPASLQRIAAPMSGRFRLMVANGPVAAGDVIGKFEDAELRSAVDTARLRLRAAQQLEADFAGEAPQRRQEATTRITDLENRAALAEALAKNPALLRDLPATVQTQLAHADPAGLRAQLDAARAQLARLDQPAFAETSTARLQVLDAERAVREAEKQLDDCTVTAPMAGLFQASAALAGATGAVPLGGGQEIGTLRDVSRIVAVVPAFSPYVVRADLPRTQLRLVGPGGKRFSAPFRNAVTETTPVMGETRVFLYEFSPDDSRELAAMVHTNSDAAIVLVPASSIAVVAKLQAALAHPDAFRSGWAAGVPQAWPGWVLVCEGETSLGLAPAHAP